MSRFCIVQLGKKVSCSLVKKSMTKNVIDKNLNSSIDKVKEKNAKEKLVSHSKRNNSLKCYLCKLKTLSVNIASVGKIRTSKDSKTEQNKLQYK